MCKKRSSTVKFSFDGKKKCGQFQTLLNKIYIQWNHGETFTRLGADEGRFVSETWTIIHPLFNFIEQGLKMMQAHNDGEYSTGHELAPLFDSLKNPQKSKFQEDFDEYLEMNPYFFEKKIYEYLKYLDSNNGYNSWKYVLLQNKKVNYIHIDLLFVIAQSIVSLLFMENYDYSNSKTTLFLDSTAGPKKRFDMEVSKMLHKTKADFFKKNSTELDNFKKLMRENGLKTYFDIAKYIVKNCYYQRKDDNGILYRYSPNKSIEALFSKFEKILFSYEMYLWYPWISWIGTWKNVGDKAEYSNSRFDNHQFTGIYVNFKDPDKPDETDLPKIGSIAYNYDFETMIVEINTSIVSYDTYRFSNVSVHEYNRLRSGKLPETKSESIDSNSDYYKQIENYFNDSIENNPDYNKEQVFIPGRWHISQGHGAMLSHLRKKLPREE